MSNPAKSIEGRIYTNLSGYKKLLEFYNNFSKLKYQTINFDTSSIDFLEANLAAVWLAMIHCLEKDNGLSFEVPLKRDCKIYDILDRNGFMLQLYKQDNILNNKDERKSTIPLKRFTIQNFNEYVHYIDNDFLSQRGMKIQYDQREVLKESFHEIFSNVNDHAQTTEPIYVCGQFFPQRCLLKFTLVDLGIGFLRPIQSFTRSITSAEEAIYWALRGNSSKINGTGSSNSLANLYRYCQSNKGELHIISNDCYFYTKDGKVFSHKVENNIRGTTIHVVFTLA